MNAEKKANIEIPVDLTNPGQFFACCGLLELADRLWSKPDQPPTVLGWFDNDRFHLDCGHSLAELLQSVSSLSVANTMTAALLARLEELSSFSKKQRADIDGADDEKKALESLRRELPIVLSDTIRFVIDWFADDFAGGSRFKTWAGQQSVLDITQAMHGVMSDIDGPWSSRRGIGLPFNFDSDLGGQGSALDIGFSFDPLAASELTRIEGTCRPALELFCFVGLQRFRPREISGANRFVYSAWCHPLTANIASAVTCGSIAMPGDARYEFKLLYRTKYLKSFLPAIPFQGDRDE
jgi:CRISPR-associated protein Csb3